MKTTRLDGITRAVGGAALVALGAAAILAWRAPDEQVMGGAVRILFIHAGAAWTAYLAYILTAIGAIGTLLRRGPAWDRLSLASAELGVVLTSVTLITGSIWGHVVSNWWWNWGDARLVVTLLLWFLYVAYLVLRQILPGGAGRTAAAVLALLGIPLMVVNHFAVTYWQRAHPPAVVLNPAGPAVDGALLVPLLVSFVAYGLMFAALLLMRIRLETIRQEL